MSKKKFEQYIGIWQMWVATGRRHLLSEIMAEPDEPWAVVLETDNTFNAIKRQKKEQQNG